MKLYYTHHPIFQASGRLLRLSGKFTDKKVVQRMRSMGQIELYKMFEDINIFADKLESFLDCESTRPLAGSSRAKIGTAYDVYMSEKDIGCSSLTADLLNNSK